MEREARRELAATARAPRRDCILVGRWGEVGLGEVVVAGSSRLDGVGIGIGIGSALGRGHLKKGSPMGFASLRIGRVEAGWRIRDR